MNYNINIMKLKQLRIKANLTLRELSSYTNIDYSYLSKLENETKTLTDEMASRLAAFFDVDENCIKGKQYFQITVHTSDLKECFALCEYELKEFGECYESHIFNKKIINVLKPASEKTIIKIKKDTIELMKKLKTEKDIIDSVDNWAVVNLMLAQTKINNLLKECKNKKR